jgi:hypothetical protein
MTTDNPTPEGTLTTIYPFLVILPYRLLQQSSKSTSQQDLDDPMQCYNCKHSDHTYIHCKQPQIVPGIITGNVMRRTVPAFQTGVTVGHSIQVTTKV